MNAQKTNKGESLLFLFLLFLSPPAFSQDKLTIAFIYPGGEGSSADAQPILDRFFDHVQKNGGPALTGAYYPTLETGLSAVKSGKTQVGIVSLETWLTWKKSVPMEIILSTLPAASNNPRERYFFMTTAANPEIIEPARAPVAYASRPVDPVFFKSILMTNIPAEFQADFKLRTAQNLLSELKKIAAGETPGFALLDNFEYASLKKLRGSAPSLDWVKDLRLIYSSPLVPASPVVLFTPIPEEEKEKLASALLSLPNSLEGREILANLRLRGFAKPRIEEYQAVEASFENARLAAPSIPAESPN
ncbi:MAG: PhnD/SsuA/transferrin family substrate-binding protein [Deltaproteobacteria bacterium]|nr:PhnD/SsuA/transferrin family substrate-binding protein [Deltaproteobacteria bacterium]